MLRPVLFLVSLGAWAISALVLSRSELLFENLASVDRFAHSSAGGRIPRSTVLTAPSG